MSNSRGWPSMFPIAVAISLAVTTLDPIEIEQARVLQLELARFPPLRVAVAWENFALAHRDCVRNECVSVTNVMALGHWETEADYFANAWQFLKSAQDPEVDLANRLESLESLKECLSATDLLAGRMPLPPLHQFAEGPPPEWIEYKRSVYKNQ